MQNLQHDARQRIDLFPERNPVRDDEWRLYLPMVRGDGEPVRRMLELGNKVNPAIGPYKEFFEKIGIEHTSVDWNGLDGALKLDLRQPIDMPMFDMVTNIGTTEHVSGQYGVWNNIHNLTDVNGIIVSVTPYPDGRNWWWHGEWYPHERFFQQFADCNGYEIERMYPDLEEPNKNLYVRMVKREHKSFLMPSNLTFYQNKIRSR